MTFFAHSQPLPLHDARCLAISRRLPYTTAHRRRPHFVTCQGHATVCGFPYASVRANSSCESARHTPVENAPSDSPRSAPSHGKRLPPLAARVPPRCREIPAPTPALICDIGSVNLARIGQDGPLTLLCGLMTRRRRGLPSLAYPLPIEPGSCDVFELVEETALMRHAIQMAVQCLFESLASVTDDQLGGLFRHPLVYKAPPNATRMWPPRWRPRATREWSANLTGNCPGAV